MSTLRIHSFSNHYTALLMPQLSIKSGCVVLMQEAPLLSCIIICTANRPLSGSGEAYGAQRKALVGP